MVLMKISSGGNGNKNAIFVDAGKVSKHNNRSGFSYYKLLFTGIHAREWIAPAT